MIKNEFKKVILFFVSMIALMTISQKIYSQTVQTFSTVGTQNWTCPAGVTSITVECIGGGGGGGGAAASLNAAGGGGGGGAYASSVVSVVPGTTYTIVVGSNGLGGSSSGTSGSNGGNSTFNTNVVVAAGGFGGGGSTSSISLGSGGSGGAVASSIGTIKYAGGSGASGILNLSGGGGGSSAGNTSNGNNASTSTGGSAPAGGVAGASGSTVASGAIGTNGLNFGGGASGAHCGTSLISYPGGNAGLGKVILSYVCTPPTILASASPTLVCPGGTSTLTASGPLTLDQFYTAGTTTSRWFGGNAGLQTFVAGITGRMSKVRIQTATYASSTNITLNVYSGTPGSGVFLTGVTYFKGSNINSWDDVILPNGGVNLTSGNNYYLEIPSGVQIDWIGSSVDAYANGQAYFGGTPRTWDWNFEIYYDLNTYLWNPGSISVQTFTASPGSTTNYTVTVTNSTGCVNTQMITLNVNPPLSPTTTQTNVSCNGGSNGAINLTPSGGTSPYTFNWGGGITTEDRTGLLAGVYTCTITDANGCLTTKTSTVTQPATALSAGTTVSNVSCNGGSNGAINLTPSGGTPVYTFNWGGGIITEDRTGLLAGVYTCTITDANGCLTTKTSTVTQPATALSAGTTVTNVSCNGGSNGAINLTPSGGTTPYTFNWGGGITTEDRTGLIAGVYTCTVTDVNTCTVSTSANVVEPASLIANAVLTSSINCNGGSGIVTVNASGGTPTYSGTGTFTVVAGTYTYTVADLNGCTKTTTINVTQPAPLTITVSSSSSSICVGATASLTAIGASTYTWNPGLLSGNTVTVNPISTTVYTATGTSSLGCVDSKTINLVVNSNPTVSVSALSAAICSGATTTLTGSGASTYTWNPGVLTGSVAVVTPSSTTNYTLIGANSFGCTNTKTISITVNSNPTVSIVASSTAICVGSTSTLTASGATAYLWNTGGTTPSILVTPTITSTYSVTGTNAAGCSKTQTINLVVNSLPTLSISASSNSICNGAPVTLNGTGASSYTWNPGAFTSSVVVVSPSSSTDYTLTGVNVSGCIITKTVNVIVNSNPTVTAIASSSAICAGETATLSAGGAITYSWSSGSTSSLETVNPSSSSVYTVTGTDAVGCVNSATVNLNVNLLPIITINSSAAAICSGSSATLTATGANSYVWSTSESTSTIEVMPNVSSGYTVTGTDAVGCVNSQTITLTVNSLPVLSLNASPSSICAGVTSTLTVEGASTYSWSTGSTLATIFESPVATTIYTVIGTDAVGCVNTETVSLTVNALPSLTVSSTSNAVCVGNSATLTAMGADTYSWSTGGTSSSEVVSPTATTIYTVVGIDAIGCSNFDTVRVFANSLPNILTNVNTNTVCLGGVVVFSNLGANTFTLNPSALTGSTINVPMNNVGVTVYTVTGTGPLGCTNTKTVSITTFDIPSVSISPLSSTICAGQSVVLNASGANTYTWSGSGVVSNTITDFPSANTSYSVLGTDINGCSNSASATVNVSNTPTISINTPSTNVCMGYTMAVNALGASSYTWSTGATTSLINVQPFTNTTFSVVGSNGGTCTDTAFLSLTVLPLPSVSASTNNTLVCSGQMVNLSATGTATAYAWNPGTLIGASQTVQITAPITYTVYGQGANGCAFFSTVFIDTQSGDAITPITSPSVICIGDSATLLVIGGSVPSWSNNIVPNINIVTPLSTTTYTYNAVDVNGCSSFIEFTVSIDVDCNVITYNGFTPNGDGINDFWIIDNIGKYINNKVYIYNRWGNKIFNAINYDNVVNVWDGKIKGKTVDAGTYFFVITDDSDRLIKKGWIEITN